MSALNRDHKYLMQLFLSNKVLAKEKYEEAHLKIFEDALSPEKSMKKLNEALRKNNVPFKISEVICEITDNLVYVFHPIIKCKFNAMEDAFNLVEKEYIGLLFRKIATSGCGRISSFEAADVCTRMDNRQFSISSAEVTNAKLMKQGILTDIFNDGTLAFTALAAVELEAEFRETFEGYISDCLLCRSITFQGKTCQKCEVKIHEYCLKKVGHLCPICKAKVNA